MRECANLGDQFSNRQVVTQEGRRVGRKVIKVVYSRVGT